MAESGKPMKYEYRARWKRTDDTRWRNKVYQRVDAAIRKALRVGPQPWKGLQCQWYDDEESGHDAEQDFMNKVAETHKDPYFAPVIEMMIQRREVGAWEDTEDGTEEIAGILAKSKVIADKQPIPEEIEYPF